MDNEGLYTWSFPSKKNRSGTWYIIALSIVIWLVVWWFFTKQYWMSFIILMIAGLYYFIENNSDDEVFVEITSLWIKIWNSFYDFSSIESYFFIYNGENAEIMRLNLNKKWIRVLDLIVNNDITIDLKNILPDYLKEWEKQDLTLQEKFIRLLKL